VNYTNFIYDEGRGIIFAYVPKVACTNWKSMMRYMAGYENWLDNRLAHDKENGGLRYLGDSADDQKIIARDDIPKFTMVRDPYSRTLSAYLNKVEKRLKADPPVSETDYWAKVLADIEAFRVNTLGAHRYDTINFEVFLYWLRDSGSWFVRDEHWAPQSILLRQPGVSFTKVGRFETLNEDAPDLLSAMGCDQGFPSQKDVKFAPTNAQQRLNAYMTDTAESLIEEIFAADFVNFDYPTRSGRSIDDMAQLNELKNSVLRSRSNNFLTVSAAFEEDEYVQKDFGECQNPAKAIAQFRRHVSENSPLEGILKGVAAANTGGEPLHLFDIGAYMGRFAVAADHAAEALKLKRKVSCFEPNPKLALPLRANLSLHGVEGSVFESAIGKETGTADFVYKPARMIGAGLRFPPSTNSDGNVVEQVPVTSLQDALPDTAVPGLVKLDLRGLELGALRSIAGDANRMSNVFLLKYYAWQADSIVGGEPFGDWLANHFHIMRIGHWLNASDVEAGLDAEALNRMAEDTGTTSYLLVAPKTCFESEAVSQWLTKEMPVSETSQ